MFFDTSCSTFSLPFLPSWLSHEGRTNMEIGILGSMTNLTAWIGYAWALLANSPNRNKNKNNNNNNINTKNEEKIEEEKVAANLRKRWTRLGIASLVGTTITPLSIKYLTNGCHMMRVGGMCEHNIRSIMAKLYYVYDIIQCTRDSISNSMDIFIKFIIKFTTCNGYGCYGISYCRINCW
jgi:hypothetical protein